MWWEGGAELSRGRDIAWPGQILSGGAVNEGVGVAGGPKELARSADLAAESHITQGRRRLVPADSISEYVQLLLREAGGDDGRAA